MKLIKKIWFKFIDFQNFILLGIFWCILIIPFGFIFQILNAKKNQSKNSSWIDANKKYHLVDLENPW